MEIQNPHSSVWHILHHILLICSLLPPLVWGAMKCDMRMFWSILSFTTFRLILTKTPRSSLLMSPSWVEKARVHYKVMSLLPDLWIIKAVAKERTQTLQIGENRIKRVFEYIWSFKQAESLMVCSSCIQKNIVSLRLHRIWGPGANRCGKGRVSIVFIWPVMIQSRQRSLFSKYLFSHFIFKLPLPAPCGN